MRLLLVMLVSAINCCRSSHDHIYSNPTDDANIANLRQSIAPTCVGCDNNQSCPASSIQRKLVMNCLFEYNFYFFLPNATASQNAVQTIRPTPAPSPIPVFLVAENLTCPEKPNSYSTHLQLKNANGQRVNSYGLNLTLIYGKIEKWFTSSNFTIQQVLVFDQLQLPFHTISRAVNDRTYQHSCQSITPPTPKCLQVLVKSCCMKVQRYYDPNIRQIREQCVMKIDIHRVSTCGLEVTLLRYEYNFLQAANLTMAGVFNGTTFVENAAVAENQNSVKLFDAKVLQKMADSTIIKFTYYAKTFQFASVLKYTCPPIVLPPIS